MEEPGPAVGNELWDKQSRPCFIYVETVGDGGHAQNKESPCEPAYFLKLNAGVSFVPQATPARRRKKACCSGPGLAPHLVISSDARLTVRNQVRNLLSIYRSPRHWPVSTGLLRFLFSRLAPDWILLQGVFIAVWHIGVDLQASNANANGHCGRRISNRLPL